MGALEGDSVVVTGASRGLGREMAVALSTAGARVALLARSPGELEAVAADAPGETLVVPTDVSRGVQVANAIEQTVEAFGTVDTIVNNAAVGLMSLTQEVRPVHEITEEEWDVIMDTNLKGAFLLTRHALPHMLASGRGNVINVSSGLGREVVAHEGSAWAPYTVSKHALETFTAVLDAEYGASGINANSLSPGARVDTGFWTHLPDAERDRLAAADVMNRAVVLLAGQGPDGISGESLPAADWEDRLET